jgi:hypothetical protein
MFKKNIDKKAGFDIKRNCFRKLKKVSQNRLAFLSVKQNTNKSILKMEEFSYGKT